MDEDPSSLENYYHTMVKIQHKLETFLENIGKLSETIEQYESNSPNSKNHSQGGSANSQLKNNIIKQIQQNGRKLEKYIMDANEQVEDIALQLEQHEAEASDLQTRYEILHNTQAQLQESIKSLKQELKNNKKSIQNTKKLSNIMSSLEEEVHCQKQAVNKLLLSQNKTVRLHNQITNKLQELEAKERTLIAKLDWNEKRQLEADRYGKDSQTYAKLLEKKNQIYKSIDHCVAQGNRAYMEKFGILSTLKSKVKDIEDIFSQLQISASEQTFIIKQIILREGVSGAQLLQSFKQQQNGENGNFDSQNQKLKINLQNFRRKLGIPINSRISYDHEKNAKVYTQPITLRQQQRQPLTQEIDSYLRETKRVTEPIKNQNVKEIKKQNNVIKEKRLSLNQLQKERPKKKTNGTMELPKLSSAPNIIKDDIYEPVSHMPIKKYTPESKQKSRKKHNSQQITKNIIYQNRRRENDRKNSGRFSTDSYNIRIRTKNGYIYKNSLEDHSEKQYSIANKSQIVSLYEKLSKLPEGNMCTCDKGESGQQTENEKSSDSNLKTTFTYMKLQKSRKKGKQSGKHMLQCRESDSEINEKSNKKQLNNNQLIDKISKVKNSSKSTNLLQKDEQDQAEIRKRLKTIHEGQEQPKSKLDIKDEQ